MDPVNENPPLPPPVGTGLPDLYAWASALNAALSATFAEYGFRLNRVLPKDGSEPMENPLPLVQFTEATTPDATLWTGGIIMVTDHASGKFYWGSDGTTWLPLDN